MKSRFCQVFAILCILAIGFIGLFPLAKSVEGHASHKAYKHTDIDCYEQDSSGWRSFCRSYTLTTSASIYPDPHHTDGGKHIPHNYKRNTHEYDSANRTYSSCSSCY